mmetsp:Transcript_49899/g.161164  ORF Transcript_49899/g.161164 Transcript_49899/m.161164 type:complete len:260 (+) Transcript_49899:121-900(+)
MISAHKRNGIVSCRLDSCVTVSLLAAAGVAALTLHAAGGAGDFNALAVASPAVNQLGEAMHLPWRLSCKMQPFGVADTWWLFDLFAWGSCASASAGSCPLMTASSKACAGSATLYIYPTSSNRAALPTRSDSTASTVAYQRTSLAASTSSSRTKSTTCRCATAWRSTRPHQTPLRSSPSGTTTTPPFTGGMPIWSMAAGQPRTRRTAPQSCPRHWRGAGSCCRRARPASHTTPTQWWTRRTACRRRSGSASSPWAVQPR